MNNLLGFPGIDIFGFTVTYYALCIMAGIITATAFSALLLKRRNMSPDFVVLLFIFCIPSAIICARLYYCIADGMEISQWFNFESIRSGGLSVIGGVAGGVAAGIIVCFAAKVNFFRAGDCVIITILIAQAIGRWGNYFNGEVYGAEITDSSLQWFPLAVNIGGRWYQALFFYESVINAIGFALLYTAAWFFVKKPNGLFVFAYFVWYGTVRAIMEPMRNPAFILGEDTVKWSQISAIVMICAGLSGIIVLLVLNYCKEGAFTGSKKGDKCAVTKYLSADKNEKPYFSKINIMGKNYPVRAASSKKRRDKNKNKDRQ